MPLTLHDCYDVVISYHHADVQEVAHIVGLLQQAGFNLWFDEKLYAGQKWVEEFEKALSTAMCAVFFFGTGAGSSQTDEIFYAAAQRTKTRNIPLIPVLLPGVSEIPPMVDLPFSGTVRCELSNLQDIGKLTEAIRHAIDDELHKRIYEIEIDVPKPARTCFLSLPKQGLNDVYNAVKQAIEEIRTNNTAEIKLTQTRETTDNTFTQDNVVHVIRESELVIALCTPPDATGSPCPKVVYELGIAHALGKPSILVTTDRRNVEEQLPALAYPTIPSASGTRPTTVIPTVEVVEYAPDNPQSSGLIKDLEGAIIKITNKMRHPFLVDPNVDEIRAMRSDFVYMRSVRQHFCAILSFGIKTYKELIGLTNLSYTLWQSINDIEAIGNVAIAQGHTQASEASYTAHCESFQNIFNELLKQHAKWKEDYFDKIENYKADVKVAFNNLKTHLHGSLHAIIISSQNWYNQGFEDERCHIKQYLAYYNRAYNRAYNNDKEHSEAPFKCLEDWTGVSDMSTEVRQLHKALTFVNGAALGMIISLLEILTENK